MDPINLPPLPLAEWQPTCDTVHGYIKVLGAVRRTVGPHQKHAYHHSVQVAAAGPTTGPLPFGRTTVELMLDLNSHQLTVTNNVGFSWRTQLRGQSVAELYDDVFEGLEAAGVEAEVDRQPFVALEAGTYDVDAVERWWSAISQIDQVLKRLRAELREETGAVQLWPHNFDIAMLWFSGRLVPGYDPADERGADEQMNFGFSPGDSSLPEPYFYATAYPLPAALPAVKLPPDAEWFQKGWQGAVIRYSRLVNAPDADERLLDYWRTVQSAGAQLMRG